MKSVCRSGRKFRLPCVPEPEALSGELARTDRDLRLLEVVSRTRRVEAGVDKDQEPIHLVVLKEIRLQDDAHRHDAHKREHEEPSGSQAADKQHSQGDRDEDEAGAQVANRDNETESESRRSPPPEALRGASRCGL